MSERLKNCEYFLVEYLPSALRETRLAVGLFLFEAAGRLVRYGFARDWRTVRCLDPQADQGLLENLPGYFEKLLQESLGSYAADEGSPPETILYEQLVRMHEEYAGALQISPPRGVRTTSPEEEFERLFRAHVEGRRPAPDQRRFREGSRPWIHARLREALERHALWDRLLKDIPVDQFTVPGDRFRIDFGYRPNGVMKYLHAISLERDWNQAKLLSYTFSRIREKTEAGMTAIVGDADRARPPAHGCKRILEDAGIAIQPLASLDPFLEQVGRELPRP